jgi:hypothetical protein
MKESISILQNSCMVLLEMGESLGVHKRHLLIIKKEINYSFSLILLGFFLLLQVVLHQRVQDRVDEPNHHKQNESFPEVGNPGLGLFFY